MRHPTHSSSSAFILCVLATFTLIVSAGAVASSDRSKAGPVKVTAITAGLGHACALTRAGSVKCWGYNGHDELGTGRGDSLAKSSTPVDVQGLSGGVTAISAGVRHSCALTSAGGVKCWGANYSGALGDGTTSRHSASVDVSGLSSGVAAVAAGYDSACALLGTGVKCWGYNAFGKLGSSGATSPAEGTDGEPRWARVVSAGQAACARCGERSRWRSPSILGTPTTGAATRVRSTGGSTGRRRAEA
jgi:alpha-tubulin suppressor-like RCC1 family protein